MHHMRRGDFEAAWQVSDTVLRARGESSCWHLPRHQQSIWDGKPLAGKRVLVRCYHGLGDTIQFIRYAPLLKACAREVIVWAQPALIPLLRTMRGIDRLTPLHDGTPGVEYEVDVEVMELPYIFRSTLQMLPTQVPYLHADPAVLPSDDNLAVGVVWTAGDWDEHRSMPFSFIEPLAQIPGITLHVLQRGAALVERPTAWGVVTGSDDILEAARLMRALDLVISVDSMPAHLAGALGVPVWNLLHAHADWRWMDHREDSPWYPTMRLFRQERPGDWGSLVERVAAELKVLAQPGMRRTPAALG